MPKGIQYLALLPNEIQIQFCRNRVNLKKNTFYHTKETIAEYLLLEFDCFNHFLDGAFVYEDTPEGEDYWMHQDDIYQYILSDGTVSDLDKDIGLYYLAEMPYSIQVQFLKELVMNHKEIGEYLLKSFINFNKFVEAAFPWRNAVRGYTFWANIANKNFNYKIKTK
jgi:hypothetical protein